MWWAAGTSVSPERSLGWLACLVAYHRGQPFIDQGRLTTPTPVCPRCSSSMVLRTAGRGRYIGQQFWGCSTFPACRARIGFEQEPVRRGVREHAPTATAGGSAQWEFDRRRRRRVDRIKRTWPLAVGATLIVMLMVYLL